MQKLKRESMNIIGKRNRIICMSEVVRRKETPNESGEDVQVPIYSIYKGAIDCTQH